LALQDDPTILIKTTGGNLSPVVCLFLKSNCFYSIIETSSLSSLDVSIQVYPSAPLPITGINIWEKPLRLTFDKWIFKYGILPIRFFDH